MSAVTLARRYDLWHGYVLRSLALVIGVSLALSGCSSRARRVVKTSETENLTKILAAYDQATRQLGRPPANLEEFKPFLTPYGNADEILRSPNDGQPYGLVWGVDVRKSSLHMMPPPALAYETQGVNGKRYVLTVMGVVPMTEEEFAQLKLPK